MCGRFALVSDGRAVAEQFGAEIPFALAPRYNIAPSQPLLVVREAQGGRLVDHLSWGLLPSWSKDAGAARRPINGRAETVSEKPSFRNAYRRRRCLVPASGYYEWVKQAESKQPVYIYPRQSTLMAIAGLWEYWEQDGNAIQSCALLTCAANQAISSLHHRMPVIIAAENYERWLDHKSERDLPDELLAPAPEHLLGFHYVSKRVNSPANDSPECIAPEAAERD
ncbi:MAG: SOS response-associated peptidase [Gammaproteobacteria bacterium]